MTVSTGTRGAAIAALALGASTLTVVGTLAATTTSADAAGRLPGCVASELAITRGGTDMATSHRYDKFRVTNTGTRTCRLFGYPTFRFRDKDGAQVGFASVPSGVAAHVVRLHPGDHTRVTVGNVVPDVTKPADCQAEDTAKVAITLAYRPHVYRVPITITICTTKQYRPQAYPVGF